eukprot:Awhi_evm1s8704
MQKTVPRYDPVTSAMKYAMLHMDADIKVNEIASLQNNKTTTTIEMKNIDK